jgi:hypothetical protein
MEAKVISFFSTKGGVGKTLVSLNLAVQLSLQNKKLPSLTRDESSFTRFHPNDGLFFCWPTLIMIVTLSTVTLTAFSADCSKVVFSLPWLEVLSAAGTSSLITWDMAYFSLSSHLPLFSSL